MDLKNFRIPNAITMFINIASRAFSSKETTMKRAHRVLAFSNIALLISIISISMHVSFQGHMPNINEELHLEQGATGIERFFSSRLKFDIYEFIKQEDKVI